MAVYSFIGYDPSVINFSGGTITLDPDYDLTRDRVNISVNDTASGNTIGSGSNSHRDNGVIFDGDRFSNENGDDTTQFGTVTAMDGSPITTGQIYLEESYTLTAPGETTITLYRVEIAGTVVGYVASSPLVDGVGYAYSTSNVTPSNAPNTSGGAIDDVPCFVAGTLIQTPHGGVPIESLKAGDQVLTAAGEAREIRWVGTKLIAPRRHCGRDLSPVRIAKGALGQNVPARDMLVSPNHRIVLSGAEVQLFVGEDRVLVAAKFLVGRPGVRRATGLDLVPYVHILLESHDILLVEGLEAESLHPGDMALRALVPEAVDEVLHLFPELRKKRFGRYGPLALRNLKRWEAQVCITARQNGFLKADIAA